MEMTVNMNGLRRKLVSAYNRTVRRLKEALEDNCSDYEIEDIHWKVDDAFDELRREIGFILCVYEDGNEKFSDMSSEFDGLLEFMEQSGEDEE